MSSKSKTKGKSWERDVCLFLSELYDESFIRVPGSGAFIGGSNQFRKETLSTEQIKLSRGDIIPPNDYPYFLVEYQSIIFGKDIYNYKIIEDISNSF